MVLLVIFSTLICTLPYMAIMLTIVNVQYVLMKWPAQNLHIPYFYHSIALLQLLILPYVIRITPLGVKAL
jgi:hypothetical protein